MRQAWTRAVAARQTLDYARQVRDQLADAGLTWKGYMEDMGNGPPSESKTCRHPAPNATDPTQNARKGDQPSDHAPVVVDLTDV